MDSGHKILFGILLVALIYIIFLQGCGNDSCPEINDTTIVTTVIDTNYFDTTIVHWKSKLVPIPYFDTMYSPEIAALIEKGRNAFVKDEDFDQDFILKYPALYIDTIRFDTVELYYSAKVRGYLDAIKIGYRLRKPFSVIRTDVFQVNVSEPAKKRSTALYLGADFETDIDSLMYFEPELSIITDKWVFSGGISLPSNPKRYKLGIKRKIF